MGSPNGARRSRLRAGRLVLLALGLLVVSLLPAGPALAAGGNYVFDGGTARERAEVRAALDASAFNWSVVPGTVTIHLVHAAIGESGATPGNIWLDADVLTAGRYSWAVIQHEYGHQVDLLLLDDAKRAVLERALGGKDWCHGVSGLQHSDYGCERFASLISWAYWPSPDNAFKPESARDESAAMPPAEFRALLAGLIGVPDTLSPRALSGRTGRPASAERPAGPAQRPRP